MSTYTRRWVTCGRHCSQVVELNHLDIDGDPVLKGPYQTRTQSTSMTDGNLVLVTLPPPDPPMA
jgi:hypothetical protein